MELFIQLTFRVTFHTLSLFHSRAYNLRAYLCESYATMEIYPYTDFRAADDETASRERRGRKFEKPSFLALFTHRCSAFFLLHR